MKTKNSPPLIAHIIFKLGVGGLENGLVNLINKIPADRYRHVIICIKNSTDFEKRIKRDNVTIYELNKREGNDFLLFYRLYKLLKEIKADIVHTRNLSAIECQIPAFLAGVKHRVHGEHGWDSFDPGGGNRKYRLLRRALSPFIQKFVPLSIQIEDYLKSKVAVSERKINRICNGVDTKKFQPASYLANVAVPPEYPFTDKAFFVLGTVGRMSAVKDQLVLVRAFIHLLAKQPEWQAKLRLVIIGDGPLHKEALALLASTGNSERAWLPGARDDIATILQQLDLFVLPSEAEGIPNTILEAMATKLPIVATNVGGIPDLVVDGETGHLVPSKNVEAMVTALECYVNDEQLLKKHGEQGLKRVLAQFSLDKMVSNYLNLYDELLKK